MFLLIGGEILAAALVSPSAKSFVSDSLSVSHQHEKQKSPNTWLLSILQFAEESNEEKDEKEDHDHLFASLTSISFINFEQWPTQVFVPQVDPEFQITHFFQLFLRNRQLLN